MKCHRLQKPQITQTCNYKTVQSITDNTFRDKVGYLLYLNMGIRYIVGLYQNYTESVSYYIL